MRYKKRHLDMIVIVAYFAPDPSVASHGEINAQLKTWVQQVKQRAPKRSRVVLCTDANARLGIPKKTIDDLLPFVGKAQPEPENLNGRLFLETLCDSEMLAFSTHYDCDPTHFGFTTSSRI